MVDFEKAKKIAIRHNKRVNACFEYDKGYRFFVQGITVDGGNSDFVVVKDTGEVFTMMAFISEYHPNPKYKEVNF